jgi:aldehyde dehydrogenase (NAD+)
MFGPVVDKLQFNKIMSYIEIGKKTATLITGGGQKGEEGFFIKPTIFWNPDPDSPIVKEEIFGPVLAIQTFETEEEAISMANATEYGLAGASQSNSPSLKYGAV